MVENGIASTVSHAIRSRLANRRRCGRPQITGRIIAQEHAVARRITYGIVVPWRDAVKEAVLRPCHTAASLAHAKPTGGVADDIDPRCRRQIAPSQMDFVFSILVESTQTVEGLKTRTGIRRVCMDGRRPQWHNVAIRDLELWRISILDPRELEEVAKPKSVAVHLNARHRLEQCDFFGLQQIDTPDEHAAWSIEQSGFTRCHRRGKKLVA